MTTIPNTKRVAVIDAIRGLAMMGIMLVNFPSINTIASEEPVRYGGISNASDQLINNLSMVFVNSRFYPIFAFLFGLGMAIFMQNAQRKGFDPYRLMRRRLFFLALFGVLHALLVWWGDILLLYAIFGVFLIPMFKFKAKYVFRMGIGVMALFCILSIIAVLPEVGLVDLDTPIYLHWLSADYDRSLVQKIYAEGSFFEIVKQRFIDYQRSNFTPMIADGTNLHEIIFFAMFFTNIFGLFLLGMAAGLANLHQTVMQYRGTVLKLWLLSLVVILPASVYFCTKDQIPYVANRILGDAFSMFYVCSMILLASYPRSSRWMYIFVPVGKMSLTAYLLHTTFGSLLLYSYGFGLYGKVGPALLVFLAFVYYGIVFVFCHYWTQYRGMGPVEMLWRRFTYGRVKSKEQHIPGSGKEVSSILTM